MSERTRISRQCELTQPVKCDSCQNYSSKVTLEIDTIISAAIVCTGHPDDQLRGKIEMFIDAECNHCGEILGDGSVEGKIE